MVIRDNSSTYDNNIEERSIEFSYQGWSSKDKDELL